MAVISHFHCFTQRHSSQHSADVVSKLPNANLVHAHSLPRSVPLWTQGSLACQLSWQNLRFNGVLVGETGINAPLCGNWGCPVLLVTGDAAVCREARELLGDGLVTVPVKTGIGRSPARQLPAQRARELIEEGSRQALGNLTAVCSLRPRAAI
jgi:D-aminopeptidase